jgi:hypothetical protein
MRLTLPAYTSRVTLPALHFRLKIISKASGHILLYKHQQKQLSQAYQT